jgi:hypothetical protein
MISIVSIQLYIETKKKKNLSVVIFTYKLKYVGFTLVIILTALSLINEVNSELNSIRILLSNLGLIIVALSKDKNEEPNSNSIRLLCFVLSTLFLYIGYHGRELVTGMQKPIELSQFITNVLVAYLATYHYIKFKRSVKTI